MKTHLKFHSNWHDDKSRSRFYHNLFNFIQLCFLIKEKFHQLHDSISSSLTHSLTHSHTKFSVLYFRILAQHMTAHKVHCNWKNLCMPKKCFIIFLSLIPLCMKKNLIKNSFFWATEIFYSCRSTKNRKMNVCVRINIWNNNKINFCTFPHTLTWRI
jgi:hypothetical protein